MYIKNVGHKITTQYRGMLLSNLNFALHMSCYLISTYCALTLSMVDGSHTATNGPFSQTGNGQ